VHDFVTSLVAVYADAPKTMTDKVQGVLNLNTGARVVSDTLKFDHGLTTHLHDELHWLDIAKRESYTSSAL